MSIEKPIHTVSIIGAEGSGKSTLAGQLLYRLGIVSEEQLQVVADRADQLGKPTRKYSFLMNTTRSERECSSTKHLSFQQFETKHFICNLIDTPGKSVFMKRTFRAQFSSTIVIGVVDPREDPFDQSVNRFNGMLRHYIAASKVCTNAHLICCINRMDCPEINNSEQAFQEITNKLAQILKRFGFLKVEYIPISAYYGDNIVEPSRAMPWYQGKTLLDSLNSSKPTADHSNGFLRIPILQVKKVRKVGTVIYGKVGAGKIQVDSNISISNINLNAKIRSIQTFGKSVNEAKAGQFVSLTLDTDDKGLIKKGMVVLGEGLPPGMVTKFFTAKFLLISHPSHRIKAGYEPTFQLQSIQARCRIVKIKQIMTSSDQVISDSPPEMRISQIGIIQCELDNPHYLEDNGELFTRFVLRDTDRLIGGGLIISLDRS